jgi:acyl-CoA synthetase (NDP forming)
VSDTVAVDAACRAAGIVRVATPKELVDTALAALSRHVSRGRRVAVVGDGGGHGVVAADTAARAGLDLPTLSQSVRDRLAAVLPKTASTSNPVDFAGGGEESRWMFEQAIRIVLESGEVDAALLTGYFGGYSAISDDFREEEVEVARALAQAAADTDRPLVVQSMYPSSPSMIALRVEGVPAYREIEAAASAVARLVHLRDAAPPGVPRLPQPVRELARSNDPGGGYFEARELLAAAGVQFPRAVRASSVEEARAAAAEVGYPIVLKALGLLHKSDAGGVVLGISDEEGLLASFSKMATELAPEAYSVERMAPVGEGVELIVGCRRDARFGPILLVGLGGLYAELLEDVVVALAPVDVPRVESLLRSLRGASLLTGARGRQALDLHAAAEVASALSQCAAAHPEVSEIEINPLLVTADAALGLDSRLVIGDERGADAS